MPKTKKTIKKSAASTNSKAAAKASVAQATDSAYFLKLVMYLILGSQFLRLSTSHGTIPLPLGLFIGLGFAMHEHFQVDRKIEYAVLLIAMFVGFYAQIGIILNV